MPGGVTERWSMRTYQVLDTNVVVLLACQVTSLILASASARRSRLLASLGLVFDVRPSGVPEQLEAGESAADHTMRLARDKAMEIAAKHPGVWVIGADTVVVLDGEILGKPVDEADARRVLARLSGREHQVLTGIALIAPDGTLREQFCEESSVRFRKLGGDEIAAYVAGGEPLDKAGSYAIQGGAADFVIRLRGSYENVVGLPVDSVRDMLQRAGLYPPRVGR